jgi:cell division cycle protein 37
MEKANQRMKMLERDMKKIASRTKGDDSDDDDDDDLDGAEGIKIELEELAQQNKARQAKLDDYEKHKKWNVDNMCEVKDERTMINPAAAAVNYTASGYAQPTTKGEKPKALVEAEEKEKAEKKLAVSAATAASTTTTDTDSKPAAAPATQKVMAGPAKPKPSVALAPKKEDTDNDFVYSYHEFTEKYADLVEEFMKISSFDRSKEFLIQHGKIILQENASNYLLLASLEDEMNGFRDKMRQTAKQSQIISNIAELAKSMNTHPGNVIIPFFNRLEQREFLEGFMQGGEAFAQKIISRAVTKKMEIDRERKSGVTEDGVDLAEVSLEDRLGPGGLDPLEVIETLPVELQEAFESRDVEQLKQVLLNMDPKDAEHHMKRCVDAGLWKAQA